MVENEMITKTDLAEMLARQTRKLERRMDQKSKQQMTGIAGMFTDQTKVMLEKFDAVDKRFEAIDKQFEENHRQHEEMIKNNGADHLKIFEKIAGHEKRIATLEQLAPA